MAIPVLFGYSLATVGASWFLNNSSLSSTDYTPRIFGWKSDARWWGIGAGALGLLVSPMMPFMGALGVGAGVASLVNWNTTAVVSRNMDQFLARQSMQPQIAPYAQAQPNQLPAFVQPFMAAAHQITQPR